MKIPTLDADEYFHLALHASTARDYHACLSYLQEVLQQQPSNARALYLRAVQHAELGLPERAVSGMKAALEIEPGLEMARFQLGLLLLFNSNRPTEAKQYLLELTNCGDAAMSAYAEALVAVADRDTALAKQKLALGLSQSSTNQPLSSLMRRLLAHLDGGSSATDNDEAERDQISLGAYRQGF